MLVTIASAAVAPLAFALLFLVFRAGRRTGIVAGAVVGAVAITAFVVTGRPVGETAPGSAISFTVPQSEAFDADLFHMRRGQFGGRLARSWVALDQSGTTFVVSYDQNGSRANPVTFVPSLSGATHAFVDLGSGDNTAATVASTTVTAMTTAGVTGATSDGATVTVLGASNLVIPPAVDTTDNSLHGMWGAQREDWGAGLVTPNSDGGTDTTTSQHLGSLADDSAIPAATNARIVGVYFWGHTAHAPRMAIGNNEVFAADPGVIDILDEGIMPASSGRISVLLFDDPIAINTDDDLWAISRGDTATAPGGPRFRNHASTPVGRGDIPLNQDIISDTVAPDANTDVIGPTYDPTNSSNFAIYMQQGALFERANNDGNYAANGALDFWVGDHNLDDEHGTQFAAAAAGLDPETTHHRFLIPQYEEALVTQVRRAYDAVDLLGADAEDCRIAFYDWPDLDFPTTPAATLIADAGLQTIDTENAYNTVTLATPVDLGVAAIGANRTTSLGWNYVTQDGTPMDTMVLPVFLDVSTGDASYLNCWEDERDAWHDDIPGASGINASAVERAPVSGVSEYRTTNTAMIHDSWAQTWNAPFVTDVADDSPNAIALEAYRIQLVGLQDAA